jgi:hypothetical protein
VPGRDHFLVPEFDGGMVSLNDEELKNKNKKKKLEDMATFGDRLKEAMDQGLGAWLPPSKPTET